jgi:hypothetical protein
MVVENTRVTCRIGPLLPDPRIVVETPVETIPPPKSQCRLFEPALGGNYILDVPGPNQTWLESRDRAALVENLIFGRIG